MLHVFVPTMINLLFPRDKVKSHHRHSRDPILADMNAIEELQQSCEVGLVFGYGDPARGLDIHLELTRKRNVNGPARKRAGPF